jgi:hypothetical protein
VLADAEPARGERRAELEAGVVDRLVERPAGRVESLGQDVDRDVVERGGDEELALAWSEVALDRSP